jgi:hypothetical protein
LKKGHHLRKAPAFKRFDLNSFDLNKCSVTASAHKASLAFHRDEKQGQAGCAGVSRHD